MINIVSSIVYMINMIFFVIYLPIIIILVLNNKSKITDEYINNMFLSYLINLGYEYDDRLEYEKNFKYYKKFLYGN